MRTTTHRGDAPRRLRRRPSTLKGRSAIAARRPTAAPDPGASAAPARPTPRQATGLPPAARGAPFRSQDHINQVSTVSGEAQSRFRSTLGIRPLRRRPSSSSPPPCTCCSTAKTGYKQQTSKTRPRSPPHPSTRADNVNRRDGPASTAMHKDPRPQVGCNSDLYGGRRCRGTG